MNRMLYIHIPFCVRKCAYCDFVSFPGREGDISRYVDALIQEMELRPSEKAVDSVFLGGGTPSLLPVGELARLLAAVARRYDLSPHAEISCEANPGTLAAPWLEAARQGGVNRLSIGVQAVQPALLKRLGRIHSFAQARTAVELARAAGFANLSVDLMYALPGQSLHDWQESLAAVLSLAPEHVSCYALTIAPDTPFGRQVQAGQLAPCGEEEELAQWALARQTLEKAGLYPYEVSNYARPRRACRHNLGYWLRREYIGLGCGAHSLLEETRFSNPASLKAYLSSIQEGRAPMEALERLTPTDAAFERLMLGLRLTHGVQLDAPARRLFGKGLEGMARAGFVHWDGRRAQLTRKGLPVMDEVLAQLWADI